MVGVNARDEKGDGKATDNGRTGDPHPNNAIRRVENITQMMKLARTASKFGFAFAESTVRSACDKTGEVIKYGGLATAAGVIGVGTVVGGAAAAPTAAAAGALMGAGAVVGGWCTKTGGALAGHSIRLAGSLADKSLQGGELAACGAAGAMQGAGAELLLGREGAQVVAELVSMYRSEFEAEGPVPLVQLVKGLVAYACLQNAALAVGPVGLTGLRWERALWGANAASRVAPAPADVSELHRFMKYAACTYGNPHMAAMGLVDPGAAFRPAIETLVARMELHSSADVLTLSWHGAPGGGLYSPGYMLVRDRASAALVLAFRGTLTTGDALTDLHCSFKTVSEASFSGKVHAGMWEAARRVAAQLEAQVSAELQAHPDWELVLTGHSLGAGVASLLALIWTAKNTFPRRKLRCFAYAPPCAMSLHLARRVAAFTTSVVYCNDFVCAWSVGSSRDLLTAARLLALEHGVVDRTYRIVTKQARAQDGSPSCSAMPCGPDPRGAPASTSGRSASSASDADWYTSITSSLHANMQSEKMYPPGRVIWILPRPKDDESCGSEFRRTNRTTGDDASCGANAAYANLCMVDVDNEAFGRLRLSRTMISDHLPGPYEKALRFFDLQQSTHR